MNMLGGGRDKQPRKLSCWDRKEARKENGFHGGDERLQRRPPRLHSQRNNTIGPITQTGVEDVDVLLLYQLTRSRGTITSH